MQDINRIRVFDTNSTRTHLYAVSKRLIKSDRDDSRTFTLVDRQRDLSDSSVNSILAPDEIRIMVRELLQIVGVLSVRIRPHEIHIRIAVTFDWEDVHEDVIRIIKTRAFPNVEPDIQLRLALPAIEGDNAAA
ncbi:MAG: hypothetical protein P4L53_23670 [Candidatus Obscuribacterales bacterium]|nr:hypothetical protein [Candidatus Obscuribacterales bacterium]